MEKAWNSCMAYFTFPGNGRGLQKYQVGLKGVGTLYNALLQRVDSLPNNKTGQMLE